MVNELDASLRVRRADVTDINSIYDFICDFVNEDFEAYKFNRAFMLNIVKPDNIYLVAEYQSKVVGFLSFHSQLLLQQGGERIGEILDLYVKPEMRNLGIGKFLLDKIKLLCRVMKVNLIEVTTELALIESHNLFIGENFVENDTKFIFNIDLDETENPPLESE